MAGGSKENCDRKTEESGGGVPSREGERGGAGEGFCGGAMSVISIQGAVRGLTHRGGRAPSRRRVEVPSLGSRARLALVSCPNAGGNFGLDCTDWDNEAYEHFPDVMPYSVKSMAWSAKRKRMRTEESRAWREEMDKLKSEWSGHGTGLRDEQDPTGDAEEVTNDDWHWCTHADAVRQWEEERKNWAENRAKAFRTAQQRLNSYRATQQNSAQHRHQPTLPDLGDPSDPLGFYTMMGIPCTATAAELKSAFRARAKDLHPDVAGEEDEAEEKMKDLLRAYGVLKDPVSRSLYDRGFTR